MKKYEKNQELKKFSQIGDLEQDMTRNSDVIRPRPLLTFVHSSFQGNIFNCPHSLKSHFVVILERSGVAQLFAEFLHIRKQ